MKPIDWIESATEPSRRYRKMVVAWENSVFALNALIRGFNAEYMKAEGEKERDFYHVMREVALKKFVIASLLELKPQIDDWFAALKKDGVLSSAAIAKRKEVRGLLAQVEKFRDIRNATFHFGDVNEPTDDLIRLYREVQATDLSLLNRILEEMLDLGCCLRDDAHLQTL